MSGGFLLEKEPEGLYPVYRVIAAGPENPDARTYNGGRINITMDNGDGFQLFGYILRDNRPVAGIAKMMTPFDKGIPVEQSFYLLDFAELDDPKTGVDHQTFREYADLFMTFGFRDGRNCFRLKFGERGAMAGILADLQDNEPSMALFDLWLNTYLQVSPLIQQEMMIADGRIVVNRYL